MKCAKIFTLLVAPLVLSGIVAYGIYVVANTTTLFSHDVFESHNQAAMIPFICFLSCAIIGLPALFYLAGVLFPVNGVILGSLESKEIEEILTAKLEVGQVFSDLSNNCKVRVKSIKITN